ncbi:MAG: GlmU family protein [Bacteroidetes bacterium]|nr:GlmU family protein [Bacteroidota bacterium]
MNYILFDDETRLSLLPFTFTRPVAEIRIGILTIREKWEHYLDQPVSYITEKFLRDKFPLKSSGENMLINGSVLPDKNLLKEINGLKPGECLVKDEVLIAGFVSGDVLSVMETVSAAGMTSTKEYTDALFKINANWDIFSKNEQALKDDFLLITQGKKSQPLSGTNRVMGAENIFIEAGARVECSVLNATSGFIYIGKNAEVMEGSLIRGPFSLGEDSVIKMGTKIYGATTIGPHCKVGGEVSNSVLFGNSNKAHEGFLGNSVIGEWCNLGADSNNSNLKNNYSTVKVWSYREENYVNTGLQFCGLMMADHSKCSINTMFNTGTVVGVSANVFGNGFPPKYIPSYSWGGSEGFSTYRIEEAIEVAQRVYERRGKKMDETDQEIMKYLFDLTTKYRAW